MESKRVKIKGIQRLVASRLVKSKTEIPHVTTIREIRMDKVLDLQRKYKEQAPDKRLTLLPFVIYSVLKGMIKYPIFNANLEGDEIVYHDQVNMGVAITVEENLVVPVIKGVQALSFFEISEAYNEMVIRTRNKSLTPSDFQDGTFTISNSGALGGEIFTPIINYPESAILGIGRVKQKAIVDSNGAIIACPMMYLCLSYDHRIINGSQAVGMLSVIEEYMQNPET